MIVRMKGDKVVSEKMEYRSLLISRFHSSTPEESDAYEKMAGLLARALAFHTPSHVVTQWTLYSRSHLQLRGQLRCRTEFPIKPLLVPFFRLHTTYCVLYKYQSNILCFIVQGIKNPWILLTLINTD